MKTRYFCEEDVFRFIWDAADADGLWNGNAEVLARKFNVSAEAAYAFLSDLCDRHLIEKLFSEKYAIMNWRERDYSGEEEVNC